MDAAAHHGRPMRARSGGARGHGGARQAHERRVHAKASVMCDFAEVETGRRRGSTWRSGTSSRRCGARAVGLADRDAAVAETDGGSSELGDAVVVTAQLGFAATAPRARVPKGRAVARGSYLLVQMNLVARAYGWIGRRWRRPRDAERVRRAAAAADALGQAVSACAAERAAAAACGRYAGVTP